MFRHSHTDCLRSRRYLQHMQYNYVNKAQFCKWPTSVYKAMLTNLLLQSKNWINVENVLTMTPENIKYVWRNLPVSHMKPVYPAAHVHVYELTPSTHVAPLAHVLPMQSSISTATIKQLQQQ